MHNDKKNHTQSWSRIMFILFSAFTSFSHKADIETNHIIILISNTNYQNITSMRKSYIH